jgi:hypothetical protein
VHEALIVDKMDHKDCFRGIDGWFYPCIELAAVLQNKIRKKIIIALLRAKKLKTNNNLLGI